MSGVRARCPFFIFLFKSDAWQCSSHTEVVWPGTHGHTELCEAALCHFRIYTAVLQA